MKIGAGMTILIEGAIYKQTLNKKTSPDPFHKESGLVFFGKPFAPIYLPFIFRTVLARASPLRSMAYSTVSSEPVEVVLRLVS